MLLLDELRGEHDLIDRVLGSFRSYAMQRSRGGGNAADAARFLCFFRVYLGEYHHSREEDALFRALTDILHLPADRGPIHTLTMDHHRMSGLLDQIEAVISQAEIKQTDLPRLQALVKEYTQSLWHHIDAENSVLLPESEGRLVKHGIQQLPSRPMTGEEQQAKAIGEELLRCYPPVADAEIIRGDGCTSCPSYADTCQGIEHEWWNEYEWEEFGEQLPSS